MEKERRALEPPLGRWLRSNRGSSLRQHCALRCPQSRRGPGRDGVGRTAHAAWGRTCCHTPSPLPSLRQGCGGRSPRATECRSRAGLGPGRSPVPAADGCPASDAPHTPRRTRAGAAPVRDGPTPALQPGPHLPHAHGVRDGSPAAVTRGPERGEDARKGEVARQVLQRLRARAGPRRRRSRMPSAGVGAPSARRRRWKRSLRPGRAAGGGA